MKNILFTRVFQPRAAFVSLIAIALVLSSGCASRFGLGGDRELKHRQLASAQAGDKAEIYNEISVAQKKKEEAYVQIIGSDIELPLTAGRDDATETRTYTFDVWVDDSVTDDIMKSVRSGAILIDVMSVKAKLEDLNYGSGTGASSDLHSKQVIRLSVESKDIYQSFTIVAKAPKDASRFEAKREHDLNVMRNYFQKLERDCRRKKECMMMVNEAKYSLSKIKSRHGAFHAENSQNLCNGKSIDELSNANPPEDAAENAMCFIEMGEAIERLFFQQNPYIAVKTIRVFNGDLHTQVYMLSDREIRDAFGSNFAKAFYVGKAYFRNKHSDKKLIVNTTSLRARTIFYREPSLGRSDKSEVEKGVDRFLPWTSNPETVPDRFGYINTLDIDQSAEAPLSENVENRIVDDIVTQDVVRQIEETMSGGAISYSEIAKRLSDQI